MGARQRAQGRAKKGKGGRGNPSPSWAQTQPTKGHPAQHRALLQDWQDYSGSNTPQSGNGLFSMSQEARNTERHIVGWGATKLRDQGIRFVSAGNLIQEDIETAAKKDEPEAQEEEQSPLQEPHQDTPQADLAAETLEVAEEAEQPSPEIPEQLPPPRRESISSLSSGEEIVFAGRQKPTPNTHLSNSKPELIPLAAIAERRTPSPGTEVKITATAHDSSTSDLDKFQNVLLPHRAKTRDRRGRPRISPDLARRVAEEEAIMQDYLENLAVDDDDDDDDQDIHDKARSVKIGKRTEHFRFFDGDTELNAKVQTKPSGDGIPDQAIDWDSADLEDFDDLSTTDEEIDEITQVLRHRSRPSGLQYLVTANGQKASDARWVLHQELKSVSAVEEIRLYEEIRALKMQETTGVSSLESDSEEDGVTDDLLDEIESENDENDRILDYTSRMTDEQIARALAKQEELGMGGDKLVLFDGQITDGDIDDIATGDDFVSFSTKNHLSSRTTSKRNRRQRDHFPSAEAFADALDQDPYGAFDIMDFDRPSLRPKRKGRKSDFPFDLGVEDEEIAEQLRNHWNKDREKKATRKRDKLAEREMALLEASERSHPVAIKAEIRQFLISETEMLELAPMDSATRASVHRLAKALKLKSQSKGADGKGIGRYPVLTKGPQTPRYSINTVWEIDALMNTRKFFPGHGVASSKGRNTPASTPRNRRGGGGVMAGASYMNGDIVGASAPELGADNKGRAMLEKMGWQEGSGLGAVGNKGGLEAIKHVVKTTKAGLG